MTAPLTTRDALAGELTRHRLIDRQCACGSGVEFGTTGEDAAHLADALLASGALTDATKLADDVRLVHEVADRVSGGVLEYHEVADVVALRETARNHLDALAAALSAQSERAEVER